MSQLGENVEDILPDLEDPLKGFLGRGVGFCGGLFLVYVQYRIE
ncbi:MAG: hypothetical protein ACW98U_04240 [Candidatus Thorarchaeota archaeon]